MTRVDIMERIHLRCRALGETGQAILDDFHAYYKERSPSTYEFAMRSASYALTKGRTEEAQRILREALNEPISVLTSRKSLTDEQKAVLYDTVACPFCGGLHISHGEVMTLQNGREFTQTKCMGCGALGPEASNGEIAKVLWGHRTPK